jgi:hypothetical protein
MSLRDIWNAWVEWTTSISSELKVKANDAFTWLIDADLIVGIGYVIGAVVTFVLVSMFFRAIEGTYKYISGMFQPKKPSFKNESEHENEHQHQHEKTTKEKAFQNNKED